MTPKQRKRARKKALRAIHADDRKAEREREQQRKGIRAGMGQLRAAAFIPSVWPSHRKGETPANVRAREVQERHRAEVDARLAKRTKQPQGRKR